MNFLLDFFLVASPSYGSCKDSQEFPHLLRIKVRNEKSLLFIDILSLSDSKVDIWWRLSAFTKITFYGALNVMTGLHIWLIIISGKIWALQYDNGEEVALLYTEKDTVR